MADDQTKGQLDRLVEHRRNTHVKIKKARRPTAQARARRRRKNRSELDRRATLARGNLKKMGQWFVVLSAASRSVLRRLARSS